MNWIDWIESKRNISERQDKGEHVEVSEIFDEADEIGKMLEKTMGTKRFNAALEALEKERTQNWINIHVLMRLKID